MAPNVAVTTVLGLVTLASTFVGWARWARPRLVQRKARIEAINDVLVGRPAVPANPITGEPEQEAVPSIGLQVRELLGTVEAINARFEAVEQQIGDCHHELHPNTGTSLRDSVDRIEQQLGIKKAGSRI